MKGVRKLSRLESRLFIALSYYEIHCGAYLLRKRPKHRDTLADIHRMMTKYRPISLPRGGGGAAPIHAYRRKNESAS